jgi:hypothetical protein
MINIIKQPYDEGSSDRKPVPLLTQHCAVGPRGNHSGSSMALIDETAITVALTAIQKTLGATAIDVQWVISPREKAAYLKAF